MGIMEATQGRKEKRKKQRATRQSRRKVKSLLWNTGTVSRGSNGYGKKRGT